MNNKIFLIKLRFGAEYWYDKDEGFTFGFIIGRFIGWGIVMQKKDSKQSEHP